MEEAALPFVVINRRPFSIARHAVTGLQKLSLYCGILVECKFFSVVSHGKLENERNQE